MDFSGKARIYGAQVDMGAYEWDGTVSGVDGDGERPLPTETALRSVYPNPFNPSVTIEFDLDRRSDVEVSIYDVRGRLVRRLMRDARGAGTHRVEWHGRDERGSCVATGVYFVRFRTPAHNDVRKIVLLK